MTYLPDEASAKAGHRETGQVGYKSKACPRPRSGNGAQTKVVDTPEWLVPLITHVPNPAKPEPKRNFGFWIADCGLRIGGIAPACLSKYGGQVALSFLLKSIEFLKYSNWLWYKSCANMM